MKRSFYLRTIFLLAIFLVVNVMLTQIASAQAKLSRNELAASFPQAAASSSGSGAPVTITLQDALSRARGNSVEFQSAVADAGIAHQQKVQARAALLPGVNVNSQFLYTEGNGTPTGRFVANNGVHEYIAQGNAHQSLAAADFAEFRRSQAAEAVARAKAEVAARGLVVTVVRSYYSLVTDERKYATAQKADEEGRRFLTISQQLEKGGEVAHSDVIKAEIQFQQVHRDLEEAQLAMQKSRLELAVLLFPNFNQDFTVVDDLNSPQPLPDYPEAEAMAARHNPDLQAALAGLHEAGSEVDVARAEYLPALSLDYFYGIDAPQFAVHSPPLPGSFASAPVRNLGYAATASLTLPVWNWGATHSKVKQAVIRRQFAQVELNATQKQILANLHSSYDEAQVARREMESLGRSAELAAESLRLTTLRYRAGESTVLEVVDAQNTLTQARNANDDGQARYRLAVANLQTVTGNF